MENLEYSRRCQRHKQPIVVNEKEKIAIDAKYKDVYTDAIQTGATGDSLNYYTCPVIGV